MNKNIVLAILLCCVLIFSGCTMPGTTDKKKTNPNAPNNNPYNNTTNPNGKDSVAPDGLTITINDGNNITNSRAVELALNAHDNKGVVNMSFSNDNTTWSSWEPYKQTKAWNLSDGSGLKTVYYKVEDLAGNTARPVGATITLDLTAPTVADTTPKKGATGVSILLRNLTLTFSEQMVKNSGPMDSMGWTAMTQPGPELFSPTWITDTKLVFDWGSDLEVNTTYTFAFHNQGKYVRDLAGNPAADYTFSFTTRPGPHVVSYTPTGSAVNTNSNISFTFDRPMDHNFTAGAVKLTYVDNGGKWVDLVPSWKGNTLTLTWNNDLYLSWKYDVELLGKDRQSGPGSFARDSEGGALEKTTNWSFVTRHAQISVLSVYVNYSKTTGMSTAYFVFVNNDDRIINNPYFTVEFFSGSGLVGKVGVTAEYGPATILTPGAHMAYSAAMADQSKIIKSATVIPSNDPNHQERVWNTPQYSGVVFLSFKGEKDRSAAGGWWINGTLKNTGGTFMQQVVLVTVFTDGVNRFLGFVETGVGSPNQLGSGESVSFNYHISGTGFPFDPTLIEGSATYLIVG